MSDIRQLLLNPRKRVKLDNGLTACTSAEDEAVPRPNIAEASGLAAPVDDDDDLLQDVIIAYWLVIEYWSTSSNFDLSGVVTISYST